MSMSDCKYIGIRKFEFVAKTQFVNLNEMEINALDSPVQKSYFF